MAAAYNQPIEEWNVSAVTDMLWMCRGAAAFNQPIEEWNVSAMTHMQYMFRGAAAFYQVERVGRDGYAVYV